MKVLGSIPRKGVSFEGMVQALARRPDRNQCLKTAQHFQYFTNDQLLTKLSREEFERVHQLHWDALVTDSSYQEAKVFNLQQVLPATLSDKIKEARYVGGNEAHQIVLLRGGKHREVFVEARSVNTLLERHPNSDWFFAWGKEYWKKPVVVVSANGFFAGELLGLLPTIALPSDTRTTTSGLKSRHLVREESEWKYKPMEEHHVGSQPKKE
jgi:hypothetical protein